MTKQKSTKRALLLSALSLLMCVSMLIGSTFAWFTDSVTSAGNKIVAGTLDIQLLMDGDVDGTYDDISESTAPIFGEGSIAQNNNAETLWEPGKTQVAYLAIKNNGNLALKYTVGLNVQNVSKDLYEVMEYAIVADADKDAPVTAWNGGNAVTVGTQSVSDSVSLGVGATHYFALVIHMNEEAGNEYQGGEVNFDLTVMATQDTVEYDSFDNQYDDITLVSDAAALSSAIAEGKNVMLTDDVAVDANTTMTVAKGASVILDLNGHDISAVSDTTGKNRQAFTVKGEMSVVGEGTVSFVHTGDNMGWSNLTAAFSVEGGTLTLGEGVTVMNNGGSDMAFGVDVNTTLGNTVLNVDGATIISSYTGVRIFNNHKTAQGTVNYNSGLIAGASRDIWAHLASSTSSAYNAIVNIADDYTYDVTEQTSGGKIYQFDNNFVVAASDEALSTAISEGATEVYLAAGTYTLPSAAKGKTLTISGTEATEIDVTSGLSYAIGANVTFEGITIKSEPEGAGYTNGFADFSYATFNNCVIDGTLGLDFSCEFNNCTFNIEGDYYNVWTWGAGTAKFTDCTFNSDGKALLVYANVLDNGTDKQTVVVDGCVFNDNGGLTDLKAAIEIGNDYNKSYELIINNTTVNGYAINDKGINTGTTLWANKNSIGTDKLNVVIDGVDVY